jgi:hypothetical protein
MMDDQGNSGPAPSFKAKTSAPLDRTLVQQTSDLNEGIHRSLETQKPPTEVKGFQIEALLGQGAYGSVWLAKEKSTGKKVAIKFFINRPGLNWALLSREVERLSSLYTSRNIVSILDVGWNHDPPFFIMEYLDNGSLGDLLEKGTIPAAKAEPLARSIAQGMYHAHQCGILHCDLKPANILLDAKNEPRICDFGQSRLSTDQTPALGTMFYMAPEQTVDAATPDSRWDIYAFGVILYQMLTGETPYLKYDDKRLSSSHSSLSQKLEVYRQAVLTAPIENRHRNTKGVDSFLANIIDGCIARDPDARFHTMREVLDLFQAREEWLRRRPILMYSLIFFIGFVLVLGPMAFYAFKMTLNETDKQLTKQAVQAEIISSNLLAGSIQRSLTDRLNQLDEISKRPALREAILKEQHLPWEERHQMRGLLDEWKEQSQIYLQSTGCNPDASWFMTDAKGVQIYRSPFGQTIGKTFNHRDYFHGRGVEYSREDTPADVKPVDKPHISIAFVSAQTRQYMVAIVIPIWNEDKTEVIALLARTSRLWELLDEWEHMLGVTQNSEGLVKLETSVEPQFTDNPTVHGSVPHNHQLDNSHFLSLMDIRDGQILSHPHMTSENMSKLTQNEIDHWKVEPEFLNKVQDATSNSRSVSFVNYRDPARQLIKHKYDGEWLAVFSPVGKTSWCAVVQEQRELIRMPVNHIRDLVFVYGLAGLVFTLSILLGFWWWMNHQIGRLNWKKYQQQFKRPV